MNTVGDRLFGVETTGACQCHIRILIPQIPARSHVRSLLSGESLEENLRVAIDAKVVDGLRVRARGVCPALDGSSVSKGRGRVPANSLHDD